jgi:hypothetical protein
MNRREYLAAGVGIGATALSGCSFMAAAETPRPDVPADELDSEGWDQTGEESGTVLEEEYLGVTVEAVQHTLQFEDAALRQRVADRTLGEVDTALSVFFASRVDFSPNLDDLPGVQGQIVDQVRENARQQFEQQMEAQGLTDIEQTDTGSIEIDTGETADTEILSAVFPFEGIDFAVGEGESVEIPPAEIGIDATMATWHHGDYVLVAGGAHPGENYQESIDDQLSDGISVSVDVDLGLQPDQYGEEIRSLIAGVQ